jgi:hypothetical protein
MVDLSELAKLPLITKFIEGCLIDSIPAGAVPKDVMIQLPDGDGAKVPARYTGFPPGLAAGNAVSVRATPQDPIRYLIASTSGATAPKVGKKLDHVLFVSTTAPNADYPTIAAAETAASAGDIILLDAEVFTESITISKALTLMALSPQETTITTAAGDTITITDDNVVLRSLTIDNTRASGTVACITSGNDGLIAENCIVTKTAGASTNSYGIHNTGGSNWVLTDIDVTVNSGTLKYAYLADTAASSVKLVRGSYTGATEDILLNHANADFELDNADIAGEISTIAAGDISGKVHDLILVKNSSGFPSDKGEIGYLDEAGEFQFTSTAQLVATWCIVEIGNSDGFNMWVRRVGDTNVKYTTAVVAAPVKGDFLVTSASLTLAQAQTTMHPAIFAVCTANGAAGQVAVQLLTGTVTRTLTNANDTVRVFTSSDSDFTATINGAPVGAAVAYTLVSGSGDTINVLSSSQVGKIVLHNTVGGRTPTALISDTAPPVITLTANAPGDWVNGDTIQARSTTVTGALPSFPTVFLYDLDLSGFLPELVRSASFTLAHADSAPGGNFFSMIHEFNGASPSFAVGDLVSGAAAGVNAVKLSPVGIFDKKVCFAVSASGVATSGIILRIRSIDVAVP